MALKKDKSHVGRATDVGKIRTANEDSMGDLIVDGGYVLIVADGMGGYRGGAIASNLVIEAIEEYFLDAKIANPDDMTKEAILMANERIYLRGKQDEEFSRMGSTCVLCLIVDDQLHTAHVGDSRIYLLREKGELQRITRDHTVVQHFVDVGLLSEEEAEGHPDSHILSRALGPRAHVDVEISETPITLNSGDRILLCSDGLTKMLSEVEIFSMLSLDLPIQKISDRLVDTANDKGGEDNITVVAFEYQAEPNKSPKKTKVPPSDIDVSDQTPSLEQITKESKKEKRENDVKEKQIILDNESEQEKKT